jgi:adenine-specific DNA glycosylase
MYTIVGLHTAPPPPPPLALLSTPLPQAMMELGATVCKPANPDCAACPLAGVCGARAAWAAYLEGGGDPEAPGAPRVTQYPGKVRHPVNTRSSRAGAVSCFSTGMVSVHVVDCGRISFNRNALSSCG